jgi:hypothetical protein
MRALFESTPTLPFWTNSRVDMASFVDPQKVIAKNAFSAFQSA